MYTRKETIGNTLVLIIWLFLTSCTASSELGSQTDYQQDNFPSATPEQVVEPSPTPQPIPNEIEVKIIPLAGPASDLSAEISSMAWHGDDLFLLPQFPDRFDQTIFKLSKMDILSFIQGDTDDPLTPEPVQLINSNFTKKIKGYEGFESLTFDEDHVYLTIEN